MDTHDLIATALWSMLAVSLVLTAFGFAGRSWIMFSIAAVLSGLFAIAAMFSIGIFILPLTLLQIVMAVRSRRTVHQPPTTG